MIEGKLYSVSSDNNNRVECEDCHTATVHSNDLLNRHTRVACQTCHIPVYAKVNATKMEWRWSEAGKLKNGEPYSEEDENGEHTYLSTKGRFVWKKNVTPDYIWFNGNADHYLLGDTVESFPIILNPLFGSYEDKESRIIPIKIHYGDQIYDNQTKMLIQPKLFSMQKGDSAFWQDFDWEQAAAAGMKRVGLPFSGDFSFVQTEMYWPVNHMVSPKDKSLNCSDCHMRGGGRLAGLTDFYLPGRDYNNIVNFIGAILLYLSIFGVLVHGSFRIVISVRNKKYGFKNSNE